MKPEEARRFIPPRDLNNDRWSAKDRSKFGNVIDVVVDNFPPVLAGVCDEFRETTNEDVLSGEGKWFNEPFEEVVKTLCRIEIAMPERDRHEVQHYSAFSIK